MWFFSRKTRLLFSGHSALVIFSSRVEAGLSKIFSVSSSHYFVLKVSHLSGVLLFRRNLFSPSFDASLFGQVSLYLPTILQYECDENRLMKQQLYKCANKKQCRDIVGATPPDQSSENMTLTRMWYLTPTPVENRC